MGDDCNDTKAELGHGDNSDCHVAEVTMVTMGCFAAEEDDEFDAKADKVIAYCNEELVMDLMQRRTLRRWTTAAEATTR